MTDTVFPATFDATFTNQVEWIDATGAGYQWRGERATPQTLTLTFRATTSALESLFRPLKPNEGKVNVLSQDDGGFVAVDRANGNNTFSLDAPPSRQPLRQSGDYHVGRYEESLVSQDVGEWDVEIEFVRDADRTDTPSISETASANDWELVTPRGTIATSRIDAEFAGTGEDGVERYEITARLTFDQAHAFEAAYPRIAGGRVRAIPDAPNVMVDDTGGDATLTLTTPSGSTVTDGDYVVTEWESERINDAFQSVSFVIGAAL